MTRFEIVLGALVLAGGFAACALSQGCSPSPSPAPTLTRGQALAAYAPTECARTAACLHESTSNACAEYLTHALTNPDAPSTCTQADVDACVRDTNAAPCEAPPAAYTLPPSCGCVP